ncbi:MAG: VWA domain-containing protein [Ilumatobacter sp.]
MTAPTLFAGVDRALFAAAYAARLRRVGLPTTLTSVERCAHGLEAIGPLSLDDVYWALRLAFVTRREQLGTFDAVFEAVFDTRPHLEMGWTGTATPRPEPPERTNRDDERLIGLTRSPDDAETERTTLPWATLPSAGEHDDDPDDDDAVGVPERVAAPGAADMDRPFDLLDDAELERVATQLEATALNWPRRRSRRRRRSSNGEISLRATLRAAQRNGGEVMRFARQRPEHRPRPIVVFLDVSGSMESYARVYLQLIRPLARARQAEVFAFATEVSRITPAIRHRSSRDAIEHMNDTVGDRFSGTRIASSLSSVLAHRTWSAATRGAVILICSDGWDTDEPPALDRAMKRLSLRAHRIVWVNPRAASDAFEPTTRGMSTAHPYCDAFLAGNTARSMAEVIDALSDE